MKFHEPAIQECLGYHGFDPKSMCQINQSLLHVAGL